MPWLIKKPCEQPLWRVGRVGSGSSYALAVRENFPAGMRFSGGKHQFDPLSTETGPNGCFRFCCLCFFMGVLDARNPDPGVGRRGFSNAPVGEPGMTGHALG